MTNDALNRDVLRELSDDEIALISGGAITDVDGGTWTVTGNQFDWGWVFSSSYAEGDGGGGGGGSSTNGMDAEHQQTEDADDTGCVNQVPDGVDLNHLNDLAKFMGTKLAGLQESTGWEWGAFIYRGSDGQLYQTDPFTGQKHDSMDGAVGHLPPGAHVVAYLHTHPEDDTMDERTLSQDDQNYISGLINADLSGASYTIDPDLLAYVVTRDEETEYHTWVYDKSERNADSPSCDL